MTSVSSSASRWSSGPSGTAAGGGGTVSTSGVAVTGTEVVGVASVSGVGVARRNCVGVAVGDSVPELHADRATAAETSSTARARASMLPSAVVGRHRHDWRADIQILSVTNGVITITRRVRASATRCRRTVDGRGATARDSAQTSDPE